MSALETIVNKGQKVVESDVIRLTELLMNELLKLDAIVGEGDIKEKRKFQVLFPSFPQIFAPDIFPVLLILYLYVLFFTVSEILTYFFLYFFIAKGKKSSKVCRNPGCDQG